MPEPRSLAAPARMLLLRPQEWALLASIICVALATAYLDPNHAYYYRPWTCLTDNLRNIAPLGMLAIGAAVVIIAGGLDLSVASVAAFSGTAAVSVMIILSPGEFGDGEWTPAWVTGAGCAAAVIVGLMVGTFHTWMIVALRLPPFIVTLGSLVGLRSFARGICWWVTGEYRGSQSEEIQFNDPFFEYLDTHVLTSCIVLAVLATFLWIILSRTVLGRHVYALGGNEQAAILSGIRTHNVKWFAYCFSAVTASIAGLFYIAKAHSLTPTTMASGYELNAIAAAVVGGTSLQGGIGTVQGTILGAIFLQAIVDAVQRIIKTSSNTYEGLVVGIVVVLAVTVNQVRDIAVSGRQLFSGWLGIAVIPVIAIALAMFALMTFGWAPGTTTGVIAFGLLAVYKAVELMRAR